MSAVATATTSSTDCWAPFNGDDLCRIVHEWTGLDWLARSADWLVAKPASILVLVVIGVVARWLLHRLVDRLTERAADGAMPAILQHGKVARVRDRFLEPGGNALERRAQRARTVASLLKSISTGVVFSIVVFMGIATLGYDIAPLIASAGILGLALGLGSQTLVRDFLAGIFLTLEDQYGVGDIVDLGEATGSVEAVKLRVTRLRDVNGTVWYVRNGEILRVRNLGQDWARTVLDIPVPPSEDLDRVRDTLLDEARGLWDDPEFRPLLLAEPELLEAGTEDRVGAGVRLVLTTAPLQQWAVAQEMRRRIRARFDADDIEIPLPRVAPGAAPAPGE